MDKWRTTKEVLAITQYNLEQALESLTKPTAEVLQLSHPEECETDLTLIGEDSHYIKSNIESLIKKVKKLQKEAMLFSVDESFTSWGTPVNYGIGKESCYKIEYDFAKRFPATFNYVSNNLKIGDMLVKEGLIKKTNISENATERHLFINFGTIKEHTTFKRKFNKYIKDIRADKILLKPSYTQVVTYWDGIIEQDTIEDSSGNVINIKNQYVLVSLGQGSWRINIKENNRNGDRENHWKPSYLRKEVAHEFLRKYKNILKRAAD